MFSSLSGKNKTNETLESIIGKSTSVVGNIDTSGALRIDGTFEGDIRSRGTVVIAESGKVQSPDITAVSVTVLGKLKGNIIASEKVELLAGSVFFGDIKCRYLSIEEGAIFRGSSETFGEDDSNTMLLTAGEETK